MVLVSILGILIGVGGMLGGIASIDNQSPLGWLAFWFGLIVLLWSITAICAVTYIDEFASMNAPPPPPRSLQQKRAWWFGRSPHR